MALTALMTLYTLQKFSGLPSKPATIDVRRWTLDQSR